MTTRPRELALRDLHESLGATWRTAGGVRVPSHYGDAAAERRTLEQGCGLWDASAADRFELLGEDRQRFLNGMVTADVAQMESGTSRYGLLTNVKGRILADATILAHPDRLWVRVPVAQGRPMREHLSKFIITDRVEIVPLGDMVPVIVAGTEMAAVLDRWLEGGSLPAVGEHRRAQVLGTEVCLSREDRFGVDAVSLWISASLVRDLVPALLAGESAPRPVGGEAVEGLRIEAGIPRFGREIGPDTFPQEAGVDDAVSYEKGCYLGQEVVARIHFRGGVQRRLVGLEGTTSKPPAAGSVISFDGREVGTLTSVAGRQGTESWVGLAILANRAEAGARVQLEDGGEARVIDPPGSPST